MNIPLNRRKPDWLKIKLPKGESYLKVKEILHGQQLNTICDPVRLHWTPVTKVEHYSIRAKVVSENVCD